MVPIIMTAHDSTAATYEWRVGTDPRIFTGRTLLLRFDQPYGSVAVHLRVTKKPNTACFPNDSGSDEQTRTLVVLAREQAPLYGDFKGHTLARPDSTFIIHIRPNSMLNLPKGCRWDLGGEIFTGSAGFLVNSRTFDPLFGAASVAGWGVLDANNRRKIRVEYTYRDVSRPLANERLHDTFIGYRQ